MHTKKTNNTNKLMQVSYYYALKKIQKLQNLIKKKKNFFFVPAGTPGTGRYFFRYETEGVICTSLLASTVYTGRYGTKSTPLDS